MAISRVEFQKLLDRMAVQIGGGFAESIAGITSGAQIAKLTAAIETGSLDEIMRAAGMRAGSWNQITEQVRAAYMEGGAFTVASEVPANFGMVFDVSNRSAQKWLRQQSSQFITNINKDQRNAIQLVLKDGMKLGKSPLNMGLDIVGRMEKVPGIGFVRTGGIIGLNAPQIQAVIKARQELLNLDPNYLTRARRIKRFDPIVQRAIDTGKALPMKTVTRLTGRYSDSLKKLRGETIGRTEALASLNASSHESMEQVIGEGLAPREAIKRVWHHGGYTKLERKGHVEMGADGGQERGMDEAFINPYTNQAMIYPGAGVASEVINCRCYVENVVDFSAVELAGEPPALPGLKTTEQIEKAKELAKLRKELAELKAERLARTAAREVAARKSLAADKKRRELEAAARAKAEKEGKKSFNADGTAPKQLGWVNTWRKKGTFNTPRLINLTKNITDPKQIKVLKEGAHYSHVKRGINMTGNTGNTAMDLAVMRHEWGHFLDDQLGVLLKQADHYLKAKLTKVAGADVVEGTWRYISGWSRPVGAMTSDAAKLNKLGERVYKKNPAADAFKRQPIEGKGISNYGNKLYQHDIIEEGWDARKYSLTDKYQSNEAIDSARIPARKLLNSSDNIIAKIYREIKKNGGQLNHLDELLLAEAVEANDLSILFYRRADFLKKALGETNESLAMLSDLIGSATAEETVGGWSTGFGHGQDYYSGKWKQHSQGTEAFANMTSLEAARGNELIDGLLEAFLPEFTKWYDEVLDLLNAQLGG